MNAKYSSDKPLDCNNVSSGIKKAGEHPAFFTLLCLVQESLQQTVQLMHKRRRIVQLTAFGQNGLIEQNVRQIGEARIVRFGFHT